MDLIKDLTSKNEKNALNAASNIINKANIEAYIELCNKSDFLFDFIKQNVAKRFLAVANENNYRNVIKLFNIYDENYADALIQILVKYANEELTDEIYDLLENGTDAQKAYCAKYFSYIPDSIALDLLNDLAFSDYEPLMNNIAQTLFVMNDTLVYNKAIELLKTDDEFIVLKAVKFLVNYGNIEAFQHLINAMKKSSMSENIAGEIAYLVNLYNLIRENQSEDNLLLLNNFINGFGEIIPLSEVFNIELYKLIQFLISLNKTKKSSQIASVLLNIKTKFITFFENEEYIFDEDKNTKLELKSINEMLNSIPDDFWENQQELLLDELNQSTSRVLSALTIIKELKITSSADKIEELLNKNNDETLLCEMVATLSILERLNQETKSIAINKVKNETLSAIIKNYN